MNILKYLLAHLLGVTKAANFEQKAAPVLVPLEAAAAQQVQQAIDTTIAHNKGYAVTQIANGLDKIGLAPVDRTLVEAVVAAGIDQVHVQITGQLTGGKSQ